jgi:CHASE2 domain-containing sensor protein
MAGMAKASADERHPDKFPVFSLIVCVVAILAALALSYPPIREKLDRVEYWTADWRTLLLADRTPEQHEHIVLVVFDPATFDGGVISPIPRDTHAQVLRTLDAMGPKAIGLDFYFVASQGADRDGAMLAALHEIKTPIVLGAIDAHTTEFNDHQRAYQEKFLADAGRPAGYLALKYDPGHIVRRTSPPLPQSPFQESFSRQVALAANVPLSGPGTSSSSTRVAWLVGPNRDTEPFLKVSAKDLLPGADEARRKELADHIKGNVVLTGIDMPNSDRHDTALSVWTGEKMLGAMIHAHILSQLLDSRYFTELAGRDRAIWLSAVGAFGLMLGWALRGRRTAFLNFSVATAVLVGIDAACYSSLRIVLPFALTLAVWFIGVMLGQHLRVLAWWVTARPRGAAPEAV